VCSDAPRVTHLLALAVVALLGVLAIRNAAAARVRVVLLVVGILAFLVGWAVLIAFVSN
jgi:hypothetical protein